MLTDEKLSMFDKMKRADFRAAFMEYKNIRLDNEEIRDRLGRIVYTGISFSDSRSQNGGDGFNVYGSTGGCSAGGRQAYTGMSSQYI